MNVMRVRKKISIFLTVVCVLFAFWLVLIAPGQVTAPNHEADNVDNDLPNSSIHRIDNTFILTSLPIVIITFIFCTLNLDIKGAKLGTRDL